MLTDSNQIFRNCFVIIFCYLTKVSSQINKCIIFEPNELSMTLSNLLYGFTQYGYKKCGTHARVFPHLRMGTARMKEDKETYEYEKQERVKMVRSSVGR